MAAWVDFIKQCLNLPVGDDFSFFIENSVNELNNKNVSNSIDAIQQFFREANKNNTINTIAIGIRNCVEYCEKRIDNISSEEDKSKTHLFLKTLMYISDEIPKIIQEGQAEEQSDKEESAKAVIDSFESKLKEFQGKINKMEKDIKAQNETIDSKAFQLIINTISILGIFVAIAFAGFGGTTIFSNVTINLETDFLQGVFSFFLVAFFLYNILFLLIYFIFTLLRNFYSNIEIVQRLNQYNAWDIFKPCFILDIILLSLTIILGILAYFF